MKFLLGKKIEMTQIFDEQGNVVPVTLILAGPCFVTQIKLQDKDGYEAIQIGFEKIEKANKIKETMKTKPYRFLREFENGDNEAMPIGRQAKIGDEINVSAFEQGDMIKVSGISKGKGYAGAVKRWGFVDKAKAHGAKDMRQLGSIGSRYPQRVIKGKKMPGRMGFRRTSVKNLKIIKIDKENNILAVKGAVPGRRGTLVEIRG